MEWPSRSGDGPRCVCWRERNRYFLIVPNAGAGETLVYREIEWNEQTEKAYSPRDV